MGIPAPPAPKRDDSPGPINNMKKVSEMMNEPGTYAIHTSIRDGETTIDIERIGDERAPEEIANEDDSKTQEHNVRINDIQITQEYRVTVDVDLSRLHDEFTMHALAGICANDYWGMQRPEKVVTRVRAIANEMIDQRKKYWRDTDER